VVEGYISDLTTAIGVVVDQAEEVLDLSDSEPEIACAHQKLEPANIVIRIGSKPICRTSRFGHEPDALIISHSL
jgi:hypothetical protein|tara:strand:+ start:699 stop:920 length:222 start_codon:yes stop_codon:yes gene_type:complete